MASEKETKEILKGTGWTVRQFMDSDGVTFSQYLAILKKGGRATEITSE